MKYTQNVGENGSTHADVFRLPAFRTLPQIELYLLAFLQASKSTGLDGRLMDEHVIPIISTNETITLRV